MDQKLGHKTFLMVGRLTWAFSVKILRARKNSSAAKLIFFRKRLIIARNPQTLHIKRQIDLLTRMVYLQESTKTSNLEKTVVDEQSMLSSLIS